MALLILCAPVCARSSRLSQICAPPIWRSAQNALEREVGGGRKRARERERTRSKKAADHTKERVRDDCGCAFTNLQQCEPSRSSRSEFSVH